MAVCGSGGERESSHPAKCCRCWSEGRSSRPHQGTLAAGHQPHVRALRPDVLPTSCCSRGRAFSLVCEFVPFFKDQINLSFGQLERSPERKRGSLLQRTKTAEPRSSNSVYISRRLRSRFLASHHQPGLIVRGLRHWEAVSFGLCHGPSGCFSGLVFLPVADRKRGTLRGRTRKVEEP